MNTQRGGISDDINVQLNALICSVSFVYKNMFCVTAEKKCLPVTKHVDYFLDRRDRVA